MNLLAALLALALPIASDSADLIRNRILNETLAQAERASADWDPGQRDCAGLVRLVYRKSLGARAPLWLGKDGARSEFRVADELVAYNFTPISKAPDRDRIRTGDVLAYFNPNKPPRDAWHLMILLRPPGTAPDRLLAVYHNGASGTEGAVRKVWLDDLAAGPPEWRPAPGNPIFVGTFRWNGWAAFQEGRN